MALKKASQDKATPPLHFKGSPDCANVLLRHWAHTVCKPQQPSGTVSAMDTTHGGQAKPTSGIVEAQKEETSVSTASGSRSCRRPTRPRATRCGGCCTTCSSVPAQCQFFGCTPPRTASPPEAAIAMPSSTWGVRTTATGSYRTWPQQGSTGYA